MKFHPIADVFPLISDTELQALSDDIKENGLIEPIWLYEDKILDGRNRFNACKLVDIEPKFKEYKGDSPASFVISLNLKRRHLTDGQKACCAVEILPMLEREANIRRLATLKRGDKKPDSKQVYARGGRSTAKAGELFDISHTMVADAKRIKEDSPKDFASIMKGDKTVSEVMRSIKKSETIKKIREFPSDKYRVIYADPPWKYGDTLSGGISDNYGGAEKHYPSMSISELCNLPIDNLASGNAVLFLWVTSPLLFECAPIIKSWGFEYKTSFVWDKVKHNMGHYNSVRHEFLLVCVKGSCQPDVNKLFDSVQTIERSKKHSEKPEAFRNIIDTLYPHGKRIELFARRKTNGWDSWGAETNN